jgi:glycosyltransferase involved in cell wall biosynthesis
VLSEPAPRVSIGLPVYNGAAFLADAIDSLLTQTFSNFELVISDNASTDATESICRDRAARDPRVRYFRNAENLGATRNFNRVAKLARGEYFKWAAHDDVHEPDCLRRCVEALDADGAVVLVYPRSREIDEAGATIRTVGTDVDADLPQAAQRFRVMIRREYSCVAIFGLVRTSALRRTKLLSTYADCDRVLLAEISLAGRIRELPEALFVHRQHRSRSVFQFPSRQTRNAWFDPSKAARPTFPYTRQFFGNLAAIRRSPLSAADRLACTPWMGEWLLRNADGLWEDVAYAVRFVLRPLKRLIVPSSHGIEGANGRRK